MWRKVAWWAPSFVKLRHLMDDFRADQWEPHWETNSFFKSACILCLIVWLWMGLNWIITQTTPGPYCRTIPTPVHMRILKSEVTWRTGAGRGRAFVVAYVCCHFMNRLSKMFTIAIFVGRLNFCDSSLIAWPPPPPKKNWPWWECSVQFWCEILDRFGGTTFSLKTINWI